MLYLIATPIGNLEDITNRALRTLREVDFVLAEDTRVTKKLLDHYSIDTPMISYHHHSGIAKVDKIIDLLRNNKNLALVTDAGTPGISDPGNRLIHELNNNLDNLKISPIPGPSAVITALSISGLPTDKFMFLGFIPHKKGRQKFLNQALDSKYTVVFYESCHRIIKCLEQIQALCRNMAPPCSPQIIICRELTKKFESIYRGNIDQVLDQVKSDPIKGEYTLIIGSLDKRSES